MEKKYNFTDFYFIALYKSHFIENISWIVLCFTHGIRVLSSINMNLTQFSKVYTKQHQSINQSINNLLMR